MAELKPEELGYIAGIIDGEGCVHIAKRKAEWIKRRNPSYQLRLSVGSTDRGLVDWLEQGLGGKIYFHSRKNPKHKDCWEWMIQSDKAVDLLVQVLPHLIIKKAQAELAVQFQKYVRPRTTAKLNSSQLAEREWFAKEMGKLNRRGPSPHNQGAMPVRKVNPQLLMFKKDSS